MKQNYKVLALTTALAVGVVMAGCGASSSTAGSTASSAAGSVPASSAASAPAEQTGDVTPIDQGTLEDMKTQSYKFAASITAVKDGQMTLDVYSYDAYTKEDIDGLQVGGVLDVHDQGDTTVTKMTVNSIDCNEENGIVTINGGIEEGGMDLCLDHDVYRTMTFDDYPVYYELGEMTLPMADDISLSDSSADVSAEAVESDGIDAVTEAISADADNWTCNNTTIFTDNGKVSNINRIWVP